MGAQTQKKWSPRRVGARRVGAQHFRVFPLSRFYFRSFFSLRRSSRGIVATGRGHEPPNCAFGLLWGHFVRAPGGPGVQEREVLGNGVRTRGPGSRKNGPNRTISGGQTPLSAQVLSEVFFLLFLFFFFFFLVSFILHFHFARNFG